MRSPWIDLLFLHGHANPTTLAWRNDQEFPLAVAHRIDVDVAALPLIPTAEPESRCCA
jgi:hypothetical protein